MSHRTFIIAGIYDNYGSDAPDPQSYWTAIVPVIQEIQEMDMTVSDEEGSQYRNYTELPKYNDMRDFFKAVRRKIEHFDEKGLDTYALSRRSYNLYEIIEEKTDELKKAFWYATDPEWRKRQDERDSEEKAWAEEKKQRRRDRTQQNKEKYGEIRAWLAGAVVEAVYERYNNYADRFVRLKKYYEDAGRYFSREYWPESPTCTAVDVFEVLETHNLPSDPRPRDQWRALTMDRQKAIKEVNNALQKAKRKGFLNTVITIGRKNREVSAYEPTEDWFGWDL
jgi:hypothetical protein